MKIDKSSIELAELIQRSMLLGLNLGCNLHIKYSDIGEVKGITLGKVDYKELGVIEGDILKIYVPDGTTEIGANAFGYDPMILNYTMLKVYLPDTCTVIRGHAFDVYMRPIKVYGKNVLYLDDYAFCNVQKDSVLNFPSLLKTMISKKAFYCKISLDIYLNLFDFSGKLEDIIR